MFACLRRWTGWLVGHDIFPMRVLRGKIGVERLVIGLLVFGRGSGYPVAYLRPFWVLAAGGVGVRERDCELHFSQLQERAGFASDFVMVQGGQCGLGLFL